MFSNHLQNRQIPSSTRKQVTKSGDFVCVLCVCLRVCVRVHNWSLNRWVYGSFNWS